MKNIISEELLVRIDEETVDEYVERAKTEGFEFESDEGARQNVRMLLLLFSMWFDEAVAHLEKQAEKKDPDRN